MLTWILPSDPGRLRLSCPLRIISSRYRKFKTIWELHNLCIYFGPFRYVNTVSRNVIQISIPLSVAYGAYGTMVILDTIDVPIHRYLTCKSKIYWYQVTTRLVDDVQNLYSVLQVYILCGWPPVYINLIRGRRNNTAFQNSVCRNQTCNNEYGANDTFTESS